MNERDQGRIGSAGARWSTKHAAVAVFIVAVLLRVWALGSIPLIITNDSTGYLANGQQISTGQELRIAVVRTPGYPLYLAVIHDVFGTSPLAVLMGNHLLGVLTCLLITVTASRLIEQWSPWPRAGPWIGTVVGVLVAVDPWILGMESYALTEAISAFVMTLSFAIASTPRRWRGQWWVTGVWGLLLGLTMGYACLVRPTFQVIVPFMAMGWLWNVLWEERAETGSSERAVRRGWIKMMGRGVAPVVCVVVGFVIPTVPWLQYNHKRGVEGFARGGDTLFVAGIARAGLLDENYAELSEKHREAYQELKPAPWDEGRIFAFLAKADGWHDGESKKALMRWAKHSIRSDFGKYAGAMGYALLWQLNRFPPDAPIKYNETAGYIGRLGADGTKPPYPFPQPNFQFNDPTYDMTPYAMRAPMGPLAKFDAWMERTYVTKRWTQGLPQIVLFITAVWTGLVCLRRRRTWGLALVIAGTGAFFAVHVVMVLPFSRYGLPAWAVWYVMLGVAVPMTVGAVRKEPQPLC